MYASAYTAYRAPPPMSARPLAGFKGPTSKGREGRREEGKKRSVKREGEGLEGRRKRSYCSDFTI